MQGLLDLQWTKQRRVLIDLEARKKRKAAIIVRDTRQAPRRELAANAAAVAGRLSPQRHAAWRPSEAGEPTLEPQHTEKGAQYGPR